MLEGGRGGGRRPAHRQDFSWHGKYIWKELEVVKHTIEVVQSCDWIAPGKEQCGTAELQTKRMCRSTVG